MFNLCSMYSLLFEVPVRVMPSFGGAFVENEPRFFLTLTHFYHMSHPSLPIYITDIFLFEAAVDGKQRRQTERPPDQRPR